MLFLKNRSLHNKEYSYDEVAPGKHKYNDVETVQFFNFLQYQAAIRSWYNCLLGKDRRVEVIL